MEKNGLPRPSDKRAQELLPDDWKVDPEKQVETGLIMKAAEDRLPNAFVRKNGQQKPKE
jgi:hypothetical protein